MRNNRTGFTLMELLIVIALIIAIMTLTIGAFSQFLASKMIQLSGRTITNSYRAAR